MIGRLILPLFLLIAFSLSTWAGGIKKERPAPPREKLSIRHGYQVSVDQYDETSRTFLLSIVKEPGVGPNYTTAESLAKAIDFQGDQKAFIKQKSQMIGSVYQLTHDLILLSPGEMTKRRKSGGAATP